MISSKQTFNFLNKAKFSTICVLAGGAHEDLRGAQIMKQIKKQSPETKFIGIGGPLMQEVGLETYANVNKFCYKPMIPYRNFLRFHIERTYHPVMAWVHWKNRTVLKDIDKTNFFKEVMAVQPAAFLSFGNEFFMRRLFTVVGDVYNNHNLLKPATFHLGRSHSMLRHEFLEYLDHHFSVIPREQINFQYFSYPNSVVGQEGIGRAWSYLYSQSAKFKSLTDETGLFLSAGAESNKEIIENLIVEERARFRKTHAIGQDKTVLFFAPGNTRTEIEWSLKVLLSGVQEFFRKPQISKIDKENFIALCSVYDDGQAKIVEQLTKHWPCKVKTTTDKYAAMCGADFGAAFNGEIVSECAALQLPIFIIDNIPLLQAYHTQLYNEWNNELNIAIKGEGYQELLSVSNTPYKIGNLLLEFYQDPKLRFFLADRYADVLYKMVPLADNIGGDSQQQLIDSKFIARKHNFTYNAISDKVLKAVQVYEGEQKQLPVWKIEDIRKGFLKTAGLQ